MYIFTYDDVANLVSSLAVAVQKEYIYVYINTYSCIYRIHIFIYMYIFVFFSYKYIYICIYIYVIQANLAVTEASRIATSMGLELSDALKRRLQLLGEISPHIRL
jgi:hypothetical protein